MVDVDYVGAVEQVECFDAGLTAETFAERKSALETNVGGVRRVATVGVAADVADAIGERIDIAVDVEAGKDGVSAAAFQSAEHGELKIPEKEVPIFGSFGENGKSEAMLDVVVAAGAVCAGIQVVVGCIPKLDIGRDVDGF